jgi:hypothetical protein
MDEKQDDGSSNEIGSLKLTIDDFVEIKVIGLGAHGKVTLAQCLKNGECYAIKRLKKEDIYIK